MKKRLLILAVVSVLAVSVTACGSSSGEVKQASGVDANVSTDEAEAEDIDAEASEDAEEASVPTAEVTLEETELYNNNGITVMATGIDIDSLWGAEISVTVTNESDTNVTVTTRNLVVNGYSLSSSGLYVDVAAGKSANDEITLYDSELAECGIETVATVGCNIHIMDADTWDDIDDGDRVTLNTSVAEGFVQPVDDSGDLLYDSNGIRVICRGLKEDSIWDGELVIFVENDSDRSISVYSDNVSVNGFMESASFWIDLYQNTNAVDGMYLLDLEDLDLESVDDISEIEFNLNIIDADTWDDIDRSDPITLHFDGGDETASE